MPAFRTAHLSPDEKWIAYSSNETGAFEVYVMRFPHLTDKQRISREGGYHPAWRQDGKELFFWGSNSRTATVMRVDVAEGENGSTLQVGVPEPVFSHRILGLKDGRTYAVTADGRRFLLRQPSRNPPPVTLILDWTAGLEGR